MADVTKSQQYEADVNIGKERAHITIDPKTGTFIYSDGKEKKAYVTDAAKFYWTSEGPTTRYLVLPTRLIKYCGPYTIKINPPNVTIENEEAQNCIRQRFLEKGLIYNANLSVSSLGRYKTSYSWDENISTLTELNNSINGSIIFENGAIYSYNGCLYIVTKYLLRDVQLKNYSIDLKWNGKSFDFKFAPTPKSTTKERESIEKLNKAIEQISPIYGIETGKYVIYITSKNGKKYLVIKNKLTGEVSEEEILGIKREGNELIIKTDKGEHKLKIYVDKNGNPIVEFDGDRSILERILGENGTIRYNANENTYEVVDGNEIPMNKSFRDGEAYEVTKDGIAYKGAPQTGTNPIIISQGGGGLHLPAYDNIILLLIIGLFVTMIFALRRDE